MSARMSRVTAGKTSLVSLRMMCLAVCVLALTPSCVLDRTAFSRRTAEAFSRGGSYPADNSVDQESHESFPPLASGPLTRCQMRRPTPAIHTMPRTVKRIENNMALPSSSCRKSRRKQWLCKKSNIASLVVSRVEVVNSLRIPWAIPEEYPLYTDQGQDDHGLFD